MSKNRNKHKQQAESAQAIDTSVKNSTLGSDKAPDSAPLWRSTLPERLNNWDSAKKIFKAFSTIDFFKYQTKQGFLIEKLILDITTEQLNEICLVITDEKDKTYTTFDALAVIATFLLHTCANLSNSAESRLLLRMVGVDLDPILAHLNLFLK